MAEVETGRVVRVLSGAPYDRYVGRAMSRYGLEESLWQNPYKVGRDGDLQNVLANFEWRVGDMTQDHIINLDMARGVQKTNRTFHKVDLAKLDGLTLACWCPDRDGTPLTLADPEICHGQVLLRLARQASAELAS